MFTKFEIEMKSGINSNNKMYEKYRVQRGETIVKPNNNPNQNCVQFVVMIGHSQDISKVQGQIAHSSGELSGTVIGEFNFLIQNLGRITKGVLVEQPWTLGNLKTLSTCLSVQGINQRIG